MGISRYHLIIKGRVQGVSYRMSAWEQAQRLGVTGWVKNLPDGKVELVAEGDISALRQLLAWSEQGPRFAHVTQVELTESEATGEFHNFDIH